MRIIIAIGGDITPVIPAKSIHLVSRMPIKALGYLNTLKENKWNLSIKAAVGVRVRTSEVQQVDQYENEIVRKVTFLEKSWFFYEPQSDMMNLRSINEYPDTSQLIVEFITKVDKVK
ncbi:256caa8c-cefa-4590-bdd6-e9acacc5a97a [Sclerotinia trifoliorum]|uniref:256caa8c-cefa-4590-bdd6-e9acacc5a97a n=1 Tax=Sclerotinia trifoliorum TaxID=28548 RepID=A0A8H2ZU09_9HELO|nr:256caa8c-cefa-4590-bdd6-e9acacc5a97a [Sclerotinia trifoliorum]